MCPSHVHRGLPANERWDRVLELLADETRRMIIVSLLDVPADRRLPLPETAMSPNLALDRETLTLQLRHHHLPSLAEAGYIRWEETPFSVRRGPNFDEVGPPIRLLIESVDKFPRKLIRGCNVLEQQV